MQANYVDVENPAPALRPHLEAVLAAQDLRAERAEHNGERAEYNGESLAEPDDLRALTEQPK